MHGPGLGSRLRPGRGKRHEEPELDPERTRTWIAQARLAPPPGIALRVEGDDPVLASRFPIGEAAAVAVALAGAGAAHLHELREGGRQAVRADVRRAAAMLIGFLLQRADGLDARFANPVTALFEARDGRFVHLHGGFPHLARGTAELLGCAEEAAALAAAVRGWDAFALEEALAEHGLCGAAVRSVEEWAAHPHGRALAQRPVVTVERIGDAPPELPGPAARPLAGLRVLDLTRVLAGPTCARTLAEHGADVLRIGAERLPSIEPFVAETGRGKRNAFLDLDRAADVERLRALAREADVFSQGYRADALERRGLGPEALAELRPGIVYVSIDCYGPGGPFSGRRGWEQLAQSAVGIAHAEGDGGPPRLAPAAATDYTTGTLAAFGVLSALARRATEGGSWHVRASLCQTGMWLTRLGAQLDPAVASGLGDPSDLLVESDTAWGRLRHLGPMVEMERTPARFDRPPAPLGSHPAEWLPRGPAA